MANLQEAAVWENGIYQLEQNDPVLGGPPDLAQEQGFDNVPHQMLANRTAWLKAQIETLQQSLTDLTNGAPGALDTLNELAAALGDDPNFAASITSMIENAVPAGAVMAFAFDVPPTRWLECDGSAISRASYAALFSVIGTTYGNGDGATTFNLPDFRGEFLRGWDNGRGVDTGRAFGTFQKGTLNAIDTGLLDGSAIWALSTLETTVAAALTDVGLDDYSAAGDYPNTRLTNNVANAQSIFLKGAAGTQGTSGVTRPRNVALMFCIRY